MNSLASLTWQQRLNLFTQVYEGYSVALPANLNWFKSHCSDNDISLEHSPLLTDEDDAPVATALLGFRDRRAWIGGFGVIMAERGRGLSHVLLEKCLSVAAEQGAECVQLEVLQSNLAAQSTYLKGGFRFRRLLAVLEGPEVSGIEPFPAEPCWQREKGSLPGTFSRLKNEPVGSPLYEALLKMHWKIVLCQHEMIFKIES